MAKMTRRRFLWVGGCTMVALCSGCLNDDVKSDETAGLDAQEVLVEQATPVPTAAAASEPAESVDAAAPVATSVPTATSEPVADPTRVVTRCPKGLVDDPYPGRCRHYIDSDNNGFCDYSQV